MSSLKSAVFDSPKVELTMLDSLELLAPMSDVKSMLNNLAHEDMFKISIDDAISLAYL